MAYLQRSTPWPVTGLSAKELKTLFAQAEKQQVKLAKRPRASAMRDMIDKYVKDHGYTIAELYGTATAAAKSGSKKAGTRKATKGCKLGKVGGTEPPCAHDGAPATKAITAKCFHNMPSSFENGRPRAPYRACRLRLGIA